MLAGAAPSAASASPWPSSPGPRSGPRPAPRGASTSTPGSPSAPGSGTAVAHLVRYLLRPPFANDSLELLESGDVPLRLGHRWSDGTTHVRLTPFELIERLAALIPRPGGNQILYHGVLAANAEWRERIVPKPPEGEHTCERAGASSRHNHTWAEVMRRGLHIDSLECSRECGGRLRFVATIESPAVIARILRHVGLPAEPMRFTPARAPAHQCVRAVQPRASPSPRAQSMRK